MILKIKNRILGISINLPEGQTFTFHDLNRRANVSCSKAVQQNVGRWFAYFVKHAPNVPFIVIGKDTHGHLVYLKTGLIHSITATLRKEVFANESS